MASPPDDLAMSNRRLNDLMMAEIELNKWRESRSRAEPLGHALEQITLLAREQLRELLPRGFMLSITYPDGSPLLNADMVLEPPPARQAGKSTTRMIKRMIKPRSK